MRRYVIFLACAAVSAMGAPTGWMLNPIGDARTARLMGDIPRTDLREKGLVTVKLPTGQWNELTFTFWLRHFSTNATIKVGNYYQTIHLNYCPEPMRKGLPDELDGAGGWGDPDGVDVDGSLAIPYTFTPHWSYTNRVHATPDGKAVYGAYTINAVVTNEMGLSLGGEEHLLVPGTNVFNSYGGPSPYVTLTGSGNVQVGMSKLYWHEYFSRINGVNDESDGMKLTASSIVTNEMVFVSCRLTLNSTEHYTHDGMIHWEGNDVQGLYVTNSLPMNPSCRAFDSRGDYRVGLIGLGSAPDMTQIDLFDFRIHTWWLTDDDLQRTFQNGKQELIRRGIPKHKGY